METPVSARLQDKVAIVTGSASGIGATTARLFAAHGAQVIGLDRNPSPANDDGVRHLLAHVTRAGDIAADVGHVLEAHGRIDALVNNAGADVFSEPLALSDADWDRCMALNLRAAWHMARAVLPSMLAQGAGSIVNIASVHAHKIIPGAFPYPRGQTQADRTDPFASDRIRCSRHPGEFDFARPDPVPRIEAWFDAQPDPDAARRAQTELLPPKRIGTPEEVAYTALFLTRDEAPFINATDILIDGGRSQLYHE
jgi:NAD(P)-dependent dehydrogenase (short-subunit alcohol dehydrogenase family)